MTTLYIDNRPADIDRRTAISVSLSTASVTSLEKAKTGFSRSIVIPATPHNRAIMGDCEQPAALNRFNAGLHRARLECDGVTVSDGLMMLTECDLGGGGSYRFNIIGGNKRWASHAAARKISSLLPELSVTIDDATILNSWTDPEAVVRFLPVQRENRLPSNSSVNLLPTTRVLTASDYHPFLHLATLMERTFEDAGYRLVSQFMSGSFFQSLHISGLYPTRDTDTLRSSMGFRATRKGDTEAEADELGRVYANPLSHYNTVGNIAEVAESDDGSLWNNGGCFTLEQGRACFRPLREVAAAMEYDIRYVTDYRIVSRHRLAGFDTIALPYNDVRKFTLVNDFEDQRERFECGKSYRAVVTFHTKGTTYRITADEVVNPATDEVREVVVAEFSERTAKVSRSGSSTLRNLTLKELINNTWRESQSDWMLYEGWVGETGRKEIAVKLRGKVERLLPSTPKYFDTLWFGGADAGMHLTLKGDTSVRPVFNPHPAEGSKVEFAELACYRESRLTLVNAVRQMFNLCFYTDNLTRRVYVEPRGEFYSSRVVDWTDRTDLSKPVLCSELGEGMSRNIIWRYRSGDLATARHNAAAESDFGAWSAQVENVFASENDTINENLLFAPSLNSDSCLPSAPSARLLEVAEAGSDEDDLNFTPRIVSYAGMVELPAGEQWSYPSYGNSYPFAAFHNSDGAFAKPFTLCFEDRDGLAGLHRHWDGNMKLYNNSRRVTLHLHINPEEIESMVVPNGEGCDFRSAFALRIDGERGLYRLEEICDYNPHAESTRCIFIREV